MKSILLVVAFLFAAVSCTWDGVLTGVHTKLLYSEFEAASIAALDLPLADEDMRIVETSIAELDTIRMQLGHLYEASGEELLLTAAQTEQYIERIKDVYMRGSQPIVDYYKQTGITPSLKLQQYDESARLVYKNMRAQLDNANTGAALKEVIMQLGLILRVYASVTGVPAVYLNPGEIMVALG